MDNKHLTLHQTLLNGIAKHLYESIDRLETRLSEKDVTYLKKQMYLVIDNTYREIVNSSEVSKINKSVKLTEKI